MYISLHQVRSLWLMLCHLWGTLQLKLFAPLGSVCAQLSARVRQEQPFVLSEQTQPGSCCRRKPEDPDTNQHLTGNDSIG